MHIHIKNPQGDPEVLDLLDGSSSRALPDAWLAAREAAGWGDHTIRTDDVNKNAPGRCPHTNALAHRSYVAVRVRRVNLSFRQDDPSTSGIGSSTSSSSNDDGGPGEFIRQVRRPLLGAITAVQLSKAHQQREVAAKMSSVARTRGDAAGVIQQMLRRFKKAGKDK